MKNKPTQKELDKQMGKHLIKVLKYVLDSSSEIAKNSTSTIIRTCAAEMEVPNFGSCQLQISLIRDKSMYVEDGVVYASGEFDDISYN